MKTIAVTTAGSGVGGAVAKQFLKAGGPVLRIPG
jgi:NADP-dependent 3-hydroxy acid dehydrogenase YdfG